MFLLLVFILLYQASATKSQVPNTKWDSLVSFFSKSGNKKVFAEIQCLVIGF